MTEFVIRAIKDKPITVIETAGEMLAELKKQGNNLNQVVRNYYCDNDTRAELLSCVKELRQTYKSIVNSMGGTDNAAS